jgi:hypothetical protein
MERGPVDEAEAFDLLETWARSQGLSDRA